MPQQQHLVTQPHASVGAITAGAGTSGTAVVFTGAGTYDYEVQLAQLAGLVAGTTYHVTRVYTGFGNPMIEVNGIQGSFGIDMFDVGSAAVYGVGTATISNAGSGGKPGRFVLVMPAPLSTGVTVKQQAAGYYTVAEDGTLGSIVVTVAGAGYATAASQTLALTQAMFAATPGLTGVAGTFALPSVGVATAI